MHVEILDTQRLVANGLHNGFTSICHWREYWYVAYREAATHHIVPPGCVRIRRGVYVNAWQDDGANIAWSTQTYATIAHPSGDVRDPRFIVAEDALWLMCGVYVPQDTHTLSNNSPENILQTHITYTVDGQTWAPLRPILRPNAWGWSTLALPDSYLTAAYQVGTSYEESSSIVLYIGLDMLKHVPLATIHEYNASTTPAYLPTEPVLYQPTADTVACLVRTQTHMLLGVARLHALYDWRWSTLRHGAERFLHPSALLHTPHGWLLAAREVATTKTRTKLLLTFSTRLYYVNAQQVTPVATFASGGDCAYAGLCEGATAGDYLVSYYSQHAYLHTGMYGTTLPCSDIYIATIRVSA